MVSCAIPKPYLIDGRPSLVLVQQLINFEVETSNSIELALERDSLHGIMVDVIMMRTCHVLKQEA